MSSLSILASLFVASVQADSAPPASDPLTWISGDWAVVDPTTGETLQTCAQAQRFKTSSNGRHVDLTELASPDFQARYTVLHREKNRMLMFIDGEDRLTEEGDPVLWWAYFDGPDRFEWRRYDWPASARTPTWQRCPLKPADAHETTPR